MKKLLAVAIAAAFVAPLAATANPEVYGRVVVGAVHTDENFADGDQSWDTEQNASRVGVKGSEDLGGLTAVYQFEFGVDASDSGGLSGRLAYVGVAGGFGTFAMGRQTTPYYLVVDKTDIFSSNMPGANDHYLGPVRIGNAIAYIAPTFSGVTAIAALVVDSDGSEAGAASASGVDITNLAIMYNNGGLDLGVSYLDFNTDGYVHSLSNNLGASALGTNTIADTNVSIGKDSSLLGAAAKYNFGSFALMGQYERLKGKNLEAQATFDDGSGAAVALGSPTINAWGLGGEVYLGDNTIKAVYGKIDSDDLNYSENSWSVGLDHAFSKRTHVWVDYNDSGIDANKRIGLGLTHDF